MKIAITGAGGFIGKELVSYLSTRGHEILRLQRESISGPMDRFFDMRSEHSIPDLTGIDILIHTAYIKHDAQNIPESSQVNVRTTLALEKACHDAGVKFIFLSCMSAHADSISENGKYKYAIEQRLDLSRDLILRLGLVIGRGGIVEEIRSQMLKSKFIQLSDRRHTVQIIDILDLCRSIEKAIATNATGIYNVAKEKPYALSDIYRMIAARLNKKPAFIPFGSSLSDPTGIRDIKIFDCKSDMDKLGISISDAEKAAADPMA
jgi:nucleoside-diphosphate-sugar epimerase